MVDDLEQKLELIKDVKKFCFEDLGIRKNPSFKRIDNTIKHVYCFSATPKNGKIRAVRKNYRNFYDKNDLEKHSENYDTKKYDIYVREVEAVGANDMPISQDLIESSEYRLLYVIFHENYHIHFNLNRTRITISIEEAICDYLGHQATKKYVEKNHKDYLNTVEEEAKLYQRHQLTNTIINNYNKTLQRKISPESQMWQDIKTLEARLDKVQIIQKNNFINKALLQELYIYSKNTFDVMKILQDINPKNSLNKIVDYNRPINTITDLRKAIKEKL